MKTFKSYIAENRMTTHGEIATAIAAHKKAGEILNPQYKDLTDQARRVFGKDMAYVRDLILAHMRAGNEDHDLRELYYAWPHDSLVSINKAEKFAKKVKEVREKNKEH